MGELYNMTQTVDLSASGLYYLRAIGSFVLVFVLPGLVWSLVLFRKLHLVERIILSFGLSIALVTLTVFIANMVLGVTINTTNALVSISVTTGAALVFYAAQRLKESRATRR